MKRWHGYLQYKGTIMKILLLLITIILSLTPCSATIWNVGQARQYTKPSAVSSLVRDGDTVQIDAGIYPEDVARWTANDLLLTGVGGMAHLKSNGKSWGSKAIWVIGGKNTTVAYIEFSECAVPDANGAGIRLEAADLTVQYCYFHDNQNGILAGDSPESNIVIEYSEFARNGAGDGQSHNLYINHVQTLTFRYNYSHHAVVGHELKSRAYSNYILYNRLSNESDGTASREIDLPNGGLAVIMGNEIQQGTKTENSNIIGYGLEGLSNPVPHEVFLINNTIVNDRSAGSFLHLANGTARCFVRNTIFAGIGTLIVGAASTIDTSHNWNGSVAAAGFISPSNYNYGLLATSPAINRGTDVGIVDNIPLTPSREYKHPKSFIEKKFQDSIDCGAHEYLGAIGVDEALQNENGIAVFPNPSNGDFMVQLPTGTSYERINLIDPLGRNVARGILIGDRFQFLAQDLPNGVYYLYLQQNNQLVTRTVVIAR